MLTPVTCEDAEAGAWCAGYAIAFIYNWKLTLVMTASVPLIALAAIMQVGHAGLSFTH